MKPHELPIDGDEPDQATIDEWLVYLDEREYEDSDPPFE
jgi:hypothetical protein